MRLWITERREWCITKRLGDDRVVIEMTHFLEKNWENQHVHIVRGQLCVRARPVKGLAGRYSQPSKKSSSVV